MSTDKGLWATSDEATDGSLSCDPPSSSPFAPSFGDHGLHPPVNGGFQHHVPTISLLRNEGTVKINGEFLHLKFLLRGGGDGGAMRRGGGSCIRVGTDNTIECSSLLEAGIGVGHNNGEEVT